MHGKFLASAFAAFALLINAAAFGEILEDFYTRTVVEPVADMFHPEGRYMVIVGDQTLTVSAEQFMAMLNEQKTIGLKAELLELQILSKFETGDIISVAIRSRLRQSVGAQVTIIEGVNHDILMKRGDTYVVVFSVAKAEIK